MKAFLVVLEMESRIRSRRTWTLGALALLAALSVALVYASAGIAAQAGFGVSAGAVVNVYMLVVPLGALILGALSVVRERESGGLAYLAAQPVSRRQLFAAKWSALAAQVAVIVCATFAALGVALSAMRVPAGAGALVQFMLATLLFALAMATIGMALSVTCRSTPVALAAALGAWLCFVIFADVGALAGSLATHMSTAMLLAVTALNPVEAFKIASVCALEGSVDVFGPGGRLATETFGVYLMPVMLTSVLVWGALAAAYTRWRFERALDA